MTLHIHYYTLTYPIAAELQLRVPKRGDDKKNVPPKKEASRPPDNRPPKPVPSGSKHPQPKAAADGRALMKGEYTDTRFHILSRCRTLMKTQHAPM